MDEQRLRSIPLFSSLSGSERRQLARFTDEVDLDEGKELVKEGDFSWEFFVIEDGTAEVRAGDRHVADLGPGDFFGEMGVLGRTTRNATVTVTSPMTAVVMTGAQFRQMAREIPSVGQAIEQACTERGRALEGSEA